jgi:hypothetical protein
MEAIDNIETSKKTLKYFISYLDTDEMEAVYELRNKLGVLNPIIIIEKLEKLSELIEEYDNSDGKQSYKNAVNKIWTLDSVFNDSKLYKIFDSLLLDYANMLENIIRDNETYSVYIGNWNSNDVKSVKNSDYVLFLAITILYKNILPNKNNERME